MYSLWVTSLLMISCITVTWGLSCDSVEGNWYNELGSELILEKDNEGKINGELRTAVERFEGAAGDTYAAVKGIANSEALLGFSAHFNGGSSVASWIGQCMKCGGEDILQATWLLKSNDNTCPGQWKSTLINEDIFSRNDRRDRRRGPRKHLGTHTPNRPSPVVSQFSSEGLPIIPSFLGGKWYTYDGIELDLSVNDINGTIEGTYLTQEAKVIPVFGHFYPKTIPAGIVFALYGAWESSKTAQVWVGQYHSCDGGVDGLETSWLRRNFVQSCERNMEATSFGKMKFVRTPPSKSNSAENWRISSRFSDVGTRISNFFSNLFG